MRRRLRKKLAIAATGLAAGLALSEAAVRLLVPVRNIGPSFSVYDPTYGRKLKRSFRCTRLTPEFTMRFSTNSLGFRGPEPNSFPQRPILFIGDSFTMGYGVNDGEEFPAIVQRTLAKHSAANPIPVVNAGIGGVGTGRWVKFLRTEGPRFDPRWVIFQLCGNDFVDNWSEGLYAIGQKATLIEALGPPTAGFKRYAQRIIEAVPGLPYLHIVSLLREVRLGQTLGRSTEPRSNATEHNTSHETDHDELTYRLVEEVARICQRYGWPLLVVLVDLESPRQSRLRDVLERYDVPSLAIAPKDERPDLYYRVDGHWNSAGHAYVADVILAWLRANHVIAIRDDAQTS